MALFHLAIFYEAQGKAEKSCEYFRQSLKVWVWARLQCHPKCLCVSRSKGRICLKESDRVPFKLHLTESCVCLLRYVRLEVIAGSGGFIGQDAPHVHDGHAPLCHGHDELWNASRGSGTAARDHQNLQWPWPFPASRLAFLVYGLGQVVTLCQGEVWHVSTDQSWKPRVDYLLGYGFLEALQSWYISFWSSSVLKSCNWQCLPWVNHSTM